MTTVVTDKFISKQDFRRISYNRQNNHYLKIHELCQLILYSSGIVDFYSEQKHLVNSFFIDMNVIFEKFVANLFNEVFSDKYRVHEQKTEKVWSIDDVRKKSIRTDILLKNRRTGENIVIDTKYKDGLSDSDLYQIGFYIHEYSDEGVTDVKKEGFAVLPTAEKLPVEGDHSEIYSWKQGIAIIKSYLNIDQIVPLIYSKNKDDKNELKQRIQSLLKKM